MPCNSTNGKPEFLRLVKDSIINTLKLSSSIKLFYRKNDLAYFVISALCIISVFNVVFSSVFMEQLSTSLTQLRTPFKHFQEHQNLRDVNHV